VLGCPAEQLGAVGRLVTAVVAAVAVAEAAAADKEEVALEKQFLLGRQQGKDHCEHSMEVGSLGKLRPGMCS